MADASLEPAPPAFEVTGLGPGRFVMVVGPSGAGKDSLIRAARDALAGDEHYVFPRRLVTRPPSAAEDNAELTPAAFERLRRAGGFAATWTAHDLSYGLPQHIDEDITSGRTVICNVSRAVVDRLRSRYANAILIEVTAPPDILESRLLARGRAEDGPLARRLARAAPARGTLNPDVVVVNAGAFDPAVTAFLAVLR